MARCPPAPLPRFLGTDRAAPRTGRTDQAAAARFGDVRIGDIEPRPAGRSSFWPPLAENTAAPRTTGRGSQSVRAAEDDLPTRLLCRGRAAS